MGAGSFEQSLNSLQQIKIVFLKQNPEVINIAKQYFELPKNVNLVQQSAFDYLIIKNLAMICTKIVFIKVYLKT
ncbi:hypothetical protein SAMN02745724_02111 [Pseudoalteromonas denitrificans DSM 6059]|uniref:Uncharacterized protein n=1 Tax=Pseudoalteromonas denitrificans DSM 6059 TaxID=1123010 RepID=A0A1I1KLI4_9GAMM|nr:hypothetical protein SAMN02745724_02111 [Pseudoalteromonas denitrificans DSM 6059]